MKKGIEKKLRLMYLLASIGVNLGIFAGTVEAYRNDDADYANASRRRQIAALPLFISGILIGSRALKK